MQSTVKRGGSQWKNFNNSITFKAGAGMSAFLMHTPAGAFFMSEKYIYV